MMIDFIHEMCLYFLPKKMHRYTKAYLTFYEKYSIIVLFLLLKLC